MENKDKNHGLSREEIKELRAEDDIFNAMEASDYVNHYDGL